MENTIKETKSAGGVVVNKEGLILVVSQMNNTWSLPKGHIKDEEDVLEAAKREIYEESGVNQLELVSDLGNYKRFRMSKDGSENKSERKHIFMFLFKTSQLLLKPVDPENPEAKWIDKSKVADLLSHQKDKDFFLSIIDKI